MNTEDDRQFWEATSVLYGETWSAIPKITDVETQTRSHLSNRLGKRKKLVCWLVLSWSHLRQQGSDRAETRGLSHAGEGRSQEARCQQIILCPLQGWTAFFTAPSPWRKDYRKAGACTFIGVDAVASHRSLPHPWHILLLLYPNSAGKGTLHSYITQAPQKPPLKNQQQRRVLDPSKFQWDYS